MIVKVLVLGEVATVASDPRQKPALEMQVPARAVRRLFRREEQAFRMLGYFDATEGISVNTETKEEYPLDVLEIEGRVSTPQDPW